MTFYGELAPYLGVTDASVFPMHNQTANETNSGAVSVIDFGGSGWKLKARIECGTRDVFDIWNAFFLRRNGAAVPFTWPRFLRRWPDDSSIVSDAALDVASVDADNSTVTLSGYVEGERASIGDLISYRATDDGYYFGEVLNEVTAGADGLVTVLVWPRPVQPRAVNPLPRRIEALCLWRMTKVSDPAEAVTRLAWSFEAEQVISA